jgi:hypothetical protein
MAFIRASEIERRDWGVNVPVNAMSLSYAALAKAREICCSRMMWTRVEKPGQRAQNGG